jgi:hypothetical protein
MRALDPSLVGASSSRPDPQGASTSDPLRAAARIDLHDMPRRVRRGDTLSLHGQLVSDRDGAGISDAAIAVVLVGGAAREPIQLYEGRTLPGGLFEAVVELPPTLDLGAWELLVVFPGDDRFRAARSE